jgi:transcriptional regulator GlxA family with amidase domain
MTTVYFLVPPEVQLLDLTGPAHIFYEAKEYGAELKMVYLSWTQNLQEHSSAGVSLGNLCHFEAYQLNGNDILLIPGMESHLFLKTDFKREYIGFIDWLVKQHNNGAKICSVCTGAYVLGFAGLLDNKSCTTHWKYFDDFSNRFPKSNLQNDRLLVKDGTIYSSAGVSAGIDLALFLLEELMGPFFTAKIAAEVVIFFRRTDNDPQLSAFLRHRNHVEARIHKIQDFIAQNLEGKISIPLLAEKAHMSPRNLTRLFKKTTNLTIGAYIDSLRIELAQKMLKEGEKVSATTQACGLKSSNQLRTLFRRHLKKLPSELQD